LLELSSRLAAGGGAATAWSARAAEAAGLGVSECSAVPALGVCEQPPKSDSATNPTTDLRKREKKQLDGVATATM
jgi:hypothetical protein